MSAPIDHDAYIAAAAEPMRPLLQEVRAQLSAALPDAEELISYNMPGFGFDDQVIVGYAAFSKQCGVYVTHAAIAEHSDAIAAAGLKATKMGVTFSPRKPIPADLLEKLAQSARRDLGL